MEAKGAGEMLPNEYDSDGESEQLYAVRTRQVPHSLTVAPPITSNPSYRQVEPENFDCICEYFSQNSSMYLQMRSMCTNTRTLLLVHTTAVCAEACKGILERLLT